MGVAEIAMKPKEANWPQVEADYRIGTKALRTIAEENGITEGAIRKRAKRDGWARDLSAKVRAKAEELVRKELVRNEVRKESATEKESVEVEAKVQARIKIKHQGRTGKFSDQIESLSAELDLDTELPLPVKIDCAKKLGEALKTAIGLERQAFGIADNAEGDKPQDPNKQESDTEIARKVAFALALGLKEAQK